MAAQGVRARRPRAAALLSTKVVIFGAGGHGRVVADAASEAGFEVLGFIDDGVSPETQVSAWRVLGPTQWLWEHDEVAVLHGIGANDVRERLAEELAARGRAFTSVVHPSAVVSRHAEIGEGAVILALAVVNIGAVVSRGAVINTGGVVEHDVRIGEFAHVASNAVLGGSARVGRLALLGSGAVVLPGKSVGAGSIVGAGGVVARDVPPDTVAVGCPARILRHLTNGPEPQAG